MNIRNQIKPVLLLSALIQLIWTGLADAQFVTNLWTNGIVPYELNDNVPDSARAVLKETMDTFESIANINFIKKRDGDKSYIHIREWDGDINRSTGIGMEGDPQEVRIKPCCWKKATLKHELSHALGRWHTQQRYDRDEYVTIVDTNIISGQGDNFDKNSSTVYPKPVYKEYGLSGEEIYDFRSIMHYGQNTLRKPGAEGPTILVKPPYDAKYQDHLGGGKLTYLDTLVIAFLYPKDNWYFVDQTGNLKDNNTSTKYIEQIMDGSFFGPFINFEIGMDHTPKNSTLWIQPGVYEETGVFDKPMTIRAPLGHVSIGGVSSSSLMTKTANDKTNVKQVEEQVQSPEATTESVPAEFSLLQNYPNPFNPTTSIKYALQEVVHVSLKIYNIRGEEIRTLVNEQQTAGYRKVVWDGRNEFGSQVASGVYFYRLVASSPSDGSKHLFMHTGRMVLMK